MPTANRFGYWPTVFVFLLLQPMQFFDKEKHGRSAVQTSRAGEQLGPEYLSKFGVAADLWIGPVKTDYPL